MAARFSRIPRNIHINDPLTSRQFQSDAEIAEAIQFEEVLRASSASAERTRNEDLTSSRRNFIDDFEFVQRDDYDTSQPRRSVVPSRPTEDSTCVICLEEISFSSHSTGIRIAECSHNFCETCLRQFLKLKMTERQFPITCPQVGCRSTIEDYIAEIVLDEESLDKWWIKSAELAIGNKIHCPNSSCSAPLDLDPDFSQGNLVQCPMCKFSFCASCCVPWHHNITCEEYQALPDDERNPEDQLVFSLAHEKHWQRCPKCRALIERNHGCNHMRCPCGTEFCYVCGTLWRGECTHGGRGRGIALAFRGIPQMPRPQVQMPRPPVPTPRFPMQIQPMQPFPRVIGRHGRGGRGGRGG